MKLGLISAPTTTKMWKTPWKAGENFVENAIFCGELCGNLLKEITGIVQTAKSRLSSPLLRYIIGHARRDDRRF